MTDAIIRAQAEKIKALEKRCYDLAGNDCIYPTVWRIADALRVGPDGAVEFTGDAKLVEDLRQWLVICDPDRTLGQDEDNTLTLKANRPLALPK